MQENSKSVFDSEKALEMVDGDKELLKELIDLFGSDYPGRLAQLSQAIDEKDSKTIHEAAHSLKGSSGNLHLTRVYELSTEISRMGKEGKLEGIETVYKNLVEQLEKLKEISLP